jgi:predicted transcriptional regulator
MEAVKRMVNYDEWFIREVEKGIAAADRGEFIEHAEGGYIQSQKRTQILRFAQDDNGCR